MSAQEIIEQTLAADEDLQGFAAPILAQRILDDLTAASYAVVKLPESDGEDDDVQEYFGDFGIRVDHTARDSKHPRIYIDGRDQALPKRYDGKPPTCWPPHTPQRWRSDDCLLRTQPMSRTADTFPRPLPESPMDMPSMRSILGYHAAISLGRL
jgi:hypothetical protein